MIKILKYPFPYKAWLTISNDPDHTTTEAWQELNDLLFKELKLDWANAVFLFNYNLNLPNQVSLATHPEIAVQPIDTLHTWGDFVHAGPRGFSREDAEAGIELLKKYKIQPLVWVDHSRFPGNMLHHYQWGSRPTQIDGSGNMYKVYEYSLDLVKDLGIRYIWDGEVTAHIGQDRELHVRDRLVFYNSIGKIWFFLFKLPKLLFKSAAKLKLENAQYRVHVFPDGNKLYVFKRYGHWIEADIDGLAKILSKKNINRLISKGGTMVAYTHLGKSKNGKKRIKHIPHITEQALRHVTDCVKAQKLQFTPLSYMLDYLILRDNITIKNHEIRFQADGIRYQHLQLEQLLNHSFSFSGIQNLKDVSVWINGSRVNCFWEDHDNGTYTLYFK